MVVVPFEGLTEKQFRYHLGVSTAGAFAIPFRVWSRKKKTGGNAEVMQDLGTF